MYFEFIDPCAPPGAGTWGPLVFTFSSCEIMLTACLKAFGRYGAQLCGSALYYLQGSYRLIVYPAPEAAAAGAAYGRLLCEYARQSGSGALAAAYVAEHGKPIAEENAIGKISYFLV